MLIMVIVPNNRKLMIEIKLQNLQLVKNRTVIQNWLLLRVINAQNVIYIRVWLIDMMMHTIVAWHQNPSQKWLIIQKIQLKRLRLLNKSSFRINKQGLANCYNQIILKISKIKTPWVSQNQHHLYNSTPNSKTNQNPNQKNQLQQKSHHKQTQSPLK